MLAVLSPAKSLDESPTPFAVPSTQPAMMKDAESLMKTARGLTQKKIRELMKISPELAKLNYDRYRSYELPFTDDNALPSAMMFDGGVYKGLDARSLKKADLQWAQDHVAILSGMYGFLRPLDLIQPYRLEMGTRLKTRRGKNLYEFWGDKITEHINALLEGHEDPTLVNLASGEYFKSVRRKKLKGRLLEIRFEDWKDDARTPKVISFLAKRARGAMARYLIENRLERAEQLQAFDVDGYEFQADRSSEAQYVFGRDFVPAS
jgi:cytoplasmic iron level regulating protein YaaA (DUF328/UPF0246 family)